MVMWALIGLLGFIASSQALNKTVCELKTRSYLASAPTLISGNTTGSEVGGLRWVANLCTKLAYPFGGAG